MNVWKLTSAGTVEKSAVANPAPSEGGLIRVRVTKITVSGADADIFAGKARVHYPLIPGRYAVGFVADDTPLFPKGTRVLLRTFRRVEPDGTAKRTFDEEDVLVHGYTCDGFMRDFVLAAPDEITPLPASVSDEQALVVHHVALAKAAIDRLGAGKGQHIAVVGANIYGVLLCQLLIYQQAAPLLIDADPAKLAFARGCGVYYTLPADDNLLSAVGEITGGRLAAGSVYVTTAGGNDRSLPFLVTSRGANTVLCGAQTGNEAFAIDLDLALKKQLSLRCVWCCADYVETAINLIANRAVDLSPYVPVPVKADNLKDFLLSYQSRPRRDEELCVVDLV